MLFKVANIDCFSTRMVDDINRSVPYPGRNCQGGAVYVETPTSPTVRLIRAANYWGEKSLQAEDGTWFVPLVGSTIEF